MREGGSKMKNDWKTKHKVLVRFTEEEYSLLKENIQRCRLFTQNYFRLLINGRRPTEKPADDFHAFYNSLRKIGSNLMQITSKAFALKMNEAYGMLKVEYGFSNHCAKILSLMLRLDQS